MCASYAILLIYAIDKAGVYMLSKFLNSSKAYADQQEQLEAEALLAARLAYKHNLASTSDITLLVEAVLAEAQQGG